MQGEKTMVEKLIPILENKEESEIKEMIHTFRGKQVMLDSDIAVLFNVETRIINQQVKRNFNRFPEDFCFQLNSIEFKILTSQNVISNSGGRRYRPFVYTEHGIIALASVLKSDIAAAMSVKIVRAFVENRKALSALQQYALGLTTLRNDFDEFKDETTKTIDMILKKMESNEPLKEKLLLNGEYFDAYESMIKLVERAKESLVLVDPYADDKSLVILTHKSKGVKVTIYKGNHSKLKEAEIEAFNKQYGGLLVKDYNLAHNRYLIIDSSEVYDLGTSINNMGGKIFTINKQEIKEVRDVLINMFII